MANHDETASPEIQNNTEAQENISNQLKNVCSEISTLVENNYGMIPVPHESAHNAENRPLNGYDSEMLGYAMITAERSGDKELFRKLAQGLKNFGPLPESGVYGAILDENKEHWNGKGESWSDANQDIAVALIEAGGEYSQLGVDLAKNFVKSGHIKEIDGKMFVFSRPVEYMESILGEHVKTFDVSQFNFRLYELMSQIEPENKIWNKLIESGLSNIEDILAQSRLPPRDIPILDGKIMNYSTIRETLNADPSLIKEDSREAMLKRLNEGTDLGELFSVDAMRIPYRLMDCNNEKAHLLAKVLVSRIPSIDGTPVAKVIAETGETTQSTETIGPLLYGTASTYVEEGVPVQDAAEAISKYREKEKDDPIYFKVWAGMALAQLSNKPKTNTMVEAAIE